MDDREQLAELIILSRPDRLRLLRGVVKHATELCSIDDDQAEGLVLAVNEACMNVIQHAYANRPDEQIVLTIYRENQHLFFELRDFAPPIDVAKVQPRDLDDVRPGGLGVHMMRNIMDAVDFLSPKDGTGNILRLTKKIT